MAKLLIIFGNKTADEILAVAKSQYQNEFDRIEKYFFETKANFDQYLEKVRLSFHDIYFNIGIVDFAVREKVRATASSSKLKAFSIIHRSAVISSTSSIGAGCFIAPHVVVSENARLEKHCIIHFHATIGHDCYLGKSCRVLPGARISGNVTVGENVLIGSNSVLFQNISVGDRTMIDALTYVRNDVDSDMLVYSRTSTCIPQIETR